MSISYKMSILGAALAVIAGGAAAQSIPKSGSLALHTAFKGSGELHQVSDTRMYLFGTWLGISYNDAGSGLFHAAQVVCGGASDMVNGAGSSGGFCTFSDGGDKVHGEWKGVISPTAPYEGSGKFLGGTGKFTGVTGGWSFKCVPVNLNTSQWTCQQKVDYRLP